MELNYLSFGQEGKIIVFLHGWQQDKRSFSPLVPFLFKQYRLFLVDLPGFGQVKLPETDISFKEYCQLVIIWLKQNQLLPVILVGHSFGGKVAAMISYLQPKLVEKLILIAPSGITQPKFWYKLKDQLPESLRKLFRSILSPILSSRDYKNAGKLLPLFKKFVKEDLQPVFAKIQNPTLIIWGKEDQELPVVQAQAIHQLIKDSQLKIIPGDHSFFQKNPEETTQLIDYFIKNDHD